MRPLGQSLAPPLRIRRASAWQRRYARRSDAAVDELLRGDAAAPDFAPLRRALFASPYYVARLRAAGLSPRDLADVRDLPHFPPLDRATLQREWLRLPALRVGSPEASEAVYVQSSGCGGQPVDILKDPYDCLHMWSVLRFFVRLLGVSLPPRPRVVLLCSLSNGIEYSVRLPLFHDGALHRISLARAEPLARLQKARPDVLFSDPAGLHWLAAQPDAPRPRLILSSAQYLAPGQRQALLRTQPAPVVNYYASADAGPIAWECLLEPGRFHLLLPEVWVEAVGGELVLTRLRESVLPLLRYRTGDRGGVVDGGCRCGRSGRSIVGFTGRRECLFRTPDGGGVDAWRLAWLFKHYPLRGFRLTQRSPDAFLLELQQDAAQPVPLDLAPRLLLALRVLGFEHARLELRTPAALAAGGEKPEPFRCLVA